MNYVVRSAPGRNIANDEGSMVEALCHSVIVSENSNLLSTYPMVFENFDYSFNGGFFVKLNNCMGSPAKNVFLDVNLLDFAILLQKILNVFFIKGFWNIHDSNCSRPKLLHDLFSCGFDDFLLKQMTVFILSIDVNI